MPQPSRVGQGIWASGLTGLTVLLIPAVLAVVCAGCSSASGDGPGGGVLVTFRQTGGFAGVDRRLTVTMQGDARLDQVRPRRMERTGRLGAEELAALQHRLVAADVPHLPRRNVNEQMRDGFEYVLTYEGRTVIAGDGAIPAGLAPVIDRLTEMLARLGG
jgi:hypothetical protein